MELSQALLKNDLDKLKEAIAVLKENKPKDEALEDLTFWLSSAISFSRPELAQELINNGATINKNTVPVFLLIKDDNVERLKIYLNNGNDVNEKIPAGLVDVKSKEIEDFPLNLAVRYKSPKAVKALLDEGADLNVIGYDNKTPLQLAIDDENEEIIQLLNIAELERNIIGMELTVSTTEQIKSTQEGNIQALEPEMKRMTLATNQSKSKPKGNQEPKSGKKPKTNKKYKGKNKKKNSLPR